MASAVSVLNLKKTYLPGRAGDNGVEALKGITLTVEEGDFFALLGPNGAGKTTLIGILAGLVYKTSGEAEIFGHDTATDSSRAKTYIGLVPQEFNFNIFEKVEDIIVTQAGSYTSRDSSYSTSRPRASMSSSGAICGPFCAR